MTGAFRFDYEPSAALPPIAWIAQVETDAVLVRCGTSVRREPGGFVEGTWVGPPEVGALPASTAVFGSGMVADGDALVVVPPSHPLERLYLYREGLPGASARRFVSNSLAGVFEAAGLEPDPDALYPPIFVWAADGLRNTIIDVPTRPTPAESSCQKPSSSGPR